MTHQTTTPTLLLLLLLPFTLSSSLLHTRRSTSCPTLCVIDQIQGKFMRLVEGNYQPELHMELCESACTQHCLLSQDPVVPHIVTHICTSNSLLCDYRHDTTCKTHIVSSMEHRLQIDIGFPSEAGTEESSTKLRTLPSGVVKEMGGESTSTGPWSTTPASHVEFEKTGEYVTISRGQHSSVCSDTSFKCPTRQEFCLGVVLSGGEVQYGCYPDKPVCSGIEGCIRVCYPKLESCLKTVSPSSSWGSSTLSPEPDKNRPSSDMSDVTVTTDVVTEVVTEHPRSSDLTPDVQIPTVDIPLTESTDDVPDPLSPTEDSTPDTDEIPPEDADSDVSDQDNLSPEIEDTELDNNSGEFYTISNDAEFENEWEEKEEDLGENETERQSSGVMLNYSVFLQLVLLLVGVCAV